MYVTKRKNLAENDRKGPSTENDSFVMLKSGDLVFSYHKIPLKHNLAFEKMMTDSE